MSLDEKAGAELKKRTLGNLYGEHQHGCKMAHRELNQRFVRLSLAI